MDRKHIVDWSPKRKGEVEAIQTVIAGLQERPLAVGPILLGVEVVLDENDSTG